jgi:hypothetical protein
MPRFSACFLSALLAQAFGLTYKPIGGWRQVAVVTVFGQPLWQHFHLLSQQGDLLLLQTDLLVLSLDQFPLQSNRLLLQADLLSQQAIFLSQLDQFFFCCHALTLQCVGLFGKPVGNLSSYKFHLSERAAHAIDEHEQKEVQYRADNAENLPFPKDTGKDTIMPRDTGAPDITMPKDARRPDITLPPENQHRPENRNRRALTHQPALGLGR